MIGFITDQRYTLIGLVIGITGFFISSDQINFEYEVGEENSKYEQQVETLNDVALIASLIWTYARKKA